MTDNPDSPPWARCDGSHTCPADTHFFGCFRSTIVDDRRERSVAENPESGPRHESRMAMTQESDSSPRVIEQCPTQWADTMSGGFWHRCNKLWPHDYEHECFCGDRCQQIGLR